jgi:molybdopterin-guanine dinucleotide biosynthesis protein A
MDNGVILAGGMSSRMGRDKALLPIGEFSSLAEYQYSRLKPLFKNLYLSAKDNKFPFDAPIIYDKSSFYAPILAISTALERLKSDIFLIAVDMPFVSIKDIKNLIEIYHNNREYDIYTFRVKGEIQPTASIYRYSSLKNIKKMAQLENYKLKELINISKTLFLDINSRDNFLNLNYFSNYEEAIRRV